MKPERWQKIDQIFQWALEREPPDRAQLLNEKCAGDADLHREVEVLLAAHDKAGSFIEQPAFDVEARAVAEDRKQLSAGETIGHYRILSQLGAGGMGEVYLAEDTMLARKVALKLLPADFTRDVDRVRRFQQEAQAASALNHPNIITIYEIAHIDDRHLIATEFIDGETLRERIRPDNGKQSRTLISEVLSIGIQIADALAAAHEAGIVHRDIKPENIMVRRRDGYVKVLDFGLAKPAIIRSYGVDTEAFTKPRVKTSAGLVMGTVNYMSPEQTRGEEVDARTDIWSLGVVLYEMLAGGAPFDRPTPSEVIAGILERDPPALADYVEDIPSELGRIIIRALTKDRQQRYQTAKDLLNDLRHLQRHFATGEKLEVSVAAESAGPQAAASAQSLTTAISTEDLPHRVNRRRGKLVMVMVTAGVVALAAAALIYWWYPSVRATPIDSIAVLPLVNNDPNTEYLSDGISETLIDSLSELDHLRVTARPTAFHYKNKDVDPQAVGRELDVRAVLMGRLRQLGDTLNIHVELVDTATGAQLWGREYERKTADLLSVKQSIVRDVTGKLRLRLSVEQQRKLSQGDTTSAEAFQSYIRGLYFWNKRTPDDIRKAIEQFQQAIDQDPNYALAYVGIADSYMLREQYAGIPASETQPKARAAVERALVIDDSLAEAHTSLAMFEAREWDFAEAEREYKRAIALNPNYARAHHWYALFLRDVRGRFDEALAEITIAQRLDPLSPAIGVVVAGTLAVKGERDTAFQEAKKVIELDPELPIGHWSLGIQYRTFGRLEQAIPEQEKAVELSQRGSLYVSELGACYAEAGNRAGAQELLEELEEKYKKRESLGQYVAEVHAALGDRDQAFAWLEKDFQARSGVLPLIAHSQLWKNLRDDPRFQDLLRRMGLTQG